MMSEFLIDLKVLLGKLGVSSNVERSIKLPPYLKGNKPLLLRDWALNSTRVVYFDQPTPHGKFFACQSI